MNAIERNALIRHFNRYFEQEYIQNGGNPCKIRISAVFLCPFVAYLSLKSTNRC